jgi:hypothetical protein
MPELVKRLDAEHGKKFGKENIRPRQGKFYLKNPYTLQIFH